MVHPCSATLIKIGDVEEAEERFATEQDAL